MCHSFLNRTVKTALKSAVTDKNKFAPFYGPLVLVIAAVFGERQPPFNGRFPG